MWHLNLCHMLNLRLTFVPAGFCLYVHVCAHANVFASSRFQLAEAWQEVEVARGRSQQLQAQVEDLQEEVSLQEARSHGDASLLSELESSLEVAELGVGKEEVLKPITLHHSLSNFTHLYIPQ